jgi:hypothetical protein
LNDAKISSCSSSYSKLPKTEFTDRHHHRLASLDNFELMHYPAVGPDEEIENRIKPHTDWGSITVRKSAITSGN